LLKNRSEASNRPRFEDFIDFDGGGDWNGMGWIVEIEEVGFDISKKGAGL